MAISKFNQMKYVTLLLMFFPVLLMAQELEAPEISKESGFYENDFSVTITHPDPQVMILYTLDGSEPTIENITGKEWNYKTYYPLQPGEEFGELYQDTMWTYEYSEPIQMQNRTPTETVLADVYTTVIRHNVHANGELFKGNILRARAYSTDLNEYSETISRNYFIVSEGNARYSIPVIALSVNNNELYDYEEGIGVPGVLFDDWRRDNPNAPMDGFAPANYQMSGSETEKRIHFNYFENGTEILNHDAGLRINGGYTRSSPNKSFRLYAKSDYGEKNFNHHFFEEYDVDKFKRLILRNSGNDAVASFFRDAFIHEMAKNLNFDIQESQPMALFINGEYNGLRNLRERYDNKYFENIHDVPEEALDFLENHLEVKEGDDVFYNEMKTFFENNSLANNAVYEQAITYLDPINFTDYYATYIYAANDDWPGNNYLFWRHKTTYDPQFNEGVKDGRFRWLLKDLDRGFYLNQRFENGYEGNTLAWATQDIEATLLIRRLLENENYKNYFINRFADLLNTTFKEERVHSIIEKYEEIYAPEIEENGQRWNNFTAKTQPWSSDVNRMKTFALNRPEFQREHLKEKFNLGDAVDIALNVSDDHHGYIKINTINIHPDTDGIQENPFPWVGVYFEGVPITLKAIPKNGFKFSHWSGVVNSEDAEITLTVTEGNYLKANFIPSSMVVEQQEMFDVKLYPNPTTGKIYLRGIVDWEDFIIYDLQGRVIKSGQVMQDSVDISEMSSGIYLIQLESKGGEKVQKRVIKK